MIIFIQIIFAVAFWGFLMYILQIIVDKFIILVQNKYNKSFLRLHKYLYACIDALFFLLPDLAIIHIHHKNLIDIISNNIWWIILIITDFIILLYILPYNFVSIILQGRNLNHKDKYSNHKNIINLLSKLHEDLKLVVEFSQPIDGNDEKEILKIKESHGPNLINDFYLLKEAVNRDNMNNKINIYNKISKIVNKWLSSHTSNTSKFKW